MCSSREEREQAVRSEPRGGAAESESLSEPSATPAEASTSARAGSFSAGAQAQHRAHSLPRPLSPSLSLSLHLSLDGQKPRWGSDPPSPGPRLAARGPSSGRQKVGRAALQASSPPSSSHAAVPGGLGWWGGGREGRLRSGTRQGEKVVVRGGCIGREVESSRGRVDYCGRGGGRRGSGRRALAGRDAGVGERGWGAARARCAPSSERASFCACASNDGPVEGERGSGPWSGKRVTRTATRRRGRGRRTRFLRHLSRILHARKRKRERTGQRMLLMSDEGCGSARFAELVEAERAARCRAGSGGCSRVRARAG